MTVDLRAERLNRGLSLAALAEQTGVPKSTLARVESGQAEPVPETKLALADFYGYKVTDIWPVDEKAAA